MKKEGKAFTKTAPALIGSRGLAIGVLLVACAFSVYIAARLAAIFPHSALPNYLIPSLVGCGSMLFQYVSRLRPGHSLFYQILAWISGLYVSFFVCILICLFVADLAYLLLVRACKLAVSGKLFTAIAAVASVPLTLCGVWHARHPVVKSYRIQIQKPMAAPLRIVQLSDLHMGPLTGIQYMQRMLKQVEALRPDLIVLTGDLFNRGKTGEGRQTDAIAEAFAELQSGQGIFAVLGNHDPQRDDPELTAFLKQAKIRLLDNSTHDAGEVLLIGRTGLVGEPERWPLTAILQGKATRQKPCIVLDHDPIGIREAAAEDMDLVLCGHTHKGQFFPMQYLTRWKYRGASFYGEGRWGRTQSVVSAGAGTFQVPLRLGSDSEIVCIHLSGERKITKDRPGKDL